MITEVLLVGLGGIGSNLLGLVAPALSRCGFCVKITLMDDDLVDEPNLGHQRFTSEDIGNAKVKVLANRFASLPNILLQPLEEKLCCESQLKNYDLIIVAVDRMEPRELVHKSKAQWLDLRCQGDGYVVLDNLTGSEILGMIPGNNNATSCQINGSFDYQNIEFGFSICATIGAQWLFQNIRKLNGYNTITPGFQMGSITHGKLEVKGVVI